MTKFEEADQRAHELISKRSAADTAHRKLEGDRENAIIQGDPRALLEIEKKLLDSRSTLLDVCAELHTVLENRDAAIIEEFSEENESVLDQHTRPITAQLNELRPIVAKLGAELALVYKDRQGEVNRVARKRENRLGFAVEHRRTSALIVQRLSFKDQS